MRRILLPVVFGILIITAGSCWAGIPHLINYQGMLTDDAGIPLTGNHDLNFAIYSQSSGGSALWTETHPGLLLQDGLFNVILGSRTTPIPSSIFDDTLRYLGISVGSDPELEPRIRLTSFGYAYRAEWADTSDYSFAAERADTSDYSLSTLAIDCSDCDDRFVNTAGPDSVVISGGTAFLGKAAGSSSGFMTGIKGQVENSGSGNTQAGTFYNYSTGTGTHSGITGATYNSCSQPTYGVYGTAENEGSGRAYGGYFFVQPEGTGAHYGISAEGYSIGADTSYGVHGYARNTLAGKEAYGGYFHTSKDGTGAHYGVKAIGYSSYTGDAYGVWGYAENKDTGKSYAGYFSTYTWGVGAHYGVYAKALSGSQSAAYGIYGYAKNTSTGLAYAGYFYADGAGTGTDYGVYAYEAAGNKGAAIYAAGDYAGSGLKYAVTKTSQGHRLLSVIESPEVWFEDFGEGQLQNGFAHIELDPLFLETVTINDDRPIKVFIELRGDCKGTYVKTYDTGFDVIELQSGTSNAPFCYRVAVKRKGYEDQRFKETDIGYEDPNLYPELLKNIEEGQ